MCACEEPSAVLEALVREAAQAASADVACVYLGDAPDTFVAAATATAGDAALAECRTTCAVPMAWDGRPRGALAVGWRDAHPVADEDRRALEAIADLATVACHVTENYRQLQAAARTDALTGLLNHGAMRDRISEEIARADRDGTPLSLVILDLDDFKRVNDVRGHQAGDDLLRRVAALLRAELRPYDVVARYGGDEFVLLLPGSDATSAEAVAERVSAAVLTGLEGACSLGVAEWRAGLDVSELLEHADRALLVAKRTGKGRVAVANFDVEQEVARLHAQRGSPAAVEALAAAIEERDGYTSRHSVEVVHLARGVAMLLGLPATQVDRIGQAALLHDVGKLSVPPDILRRAGPLSAAEWQVIREHPAAGERILLRIPELAPIAPLVRHEHERWDGTGYPDGLRGTQIPIGSRIVLACDAYQAMIVARPYRPARSPAEAVAELRRGAGTQFDPDVVEALLDLLGHSPPQVPDRLRGRRIAGPVRPRDRR
jgi:diguanylate cyclase (GGDEF)-like protein